MANPEVISDLRCSTQHHQQGRYLPYQKALEEWLEDLVKDTAKERPVGCKLHPVIQEFADLLEHDGVARMYFTEMIEQKPHRRKYTKRHIQDCDHLLRMLDLTISRAPEFNAAGAVTCPINAIFDWCMGTHASFAFFRLERINAMLRKILRVWCEYLDSPASLYVLNTGPKGWMSKEGAESVKMEQYVYDERAPHWGFKSWNDFFIRKFKDGQRPIAEPDNDKVVVNGCECTPYAIKTNIQRSDRFWIKAQPYSLHDMLDCDETTDEFVGGVVYQGFLDAHNYHRWHSPVGGKIRKTKIVNGTYYSEAESEGAQENPQGPLSHESQGYLAHVATRALIFIEANDATLGLVCFILIGMGDVSSCVIHSKFKPGAPVRKGEELGYFQFGGSSHCIVFRPNAVAEFEVDAMPQHERPHPPLLKLGVKLATAK